MIELITLDEYKAVKGITKSDQDITLASLIKNVSAIIQSYIGRKFFENGTVVSQYVDFDYDSKVIFLDEYPVDEIISLTEVNPRLPDSTVHFPTPTSAYKLLPKEGKLLRLGCGYWPQGGVEIEYLVGSGVSAATIPLELQQAAIDLVTYYWKEEYKDSKQLRGASINNNTGTGNTNTPSTNFPPHIQRVLDLFR